MNNDVCIGELYRHAYEGGSPSHGDEIDHQLMNGLGVLMNTSGHLDDVARGIALSSIACSIARFRGRGEFPSYMYFHETFHAISKQDRACILQLTIPHMACSPTCADSVWWFIEAAIENDLCPLLHLTFVEDALVHENPLIRTIGVLAMMELPISYWDQVQQRSRRSQLIQLVLSDENERVRQAVTCHPSYET